MPQRSFNLNVETCRFKAFRIQVGKTKGLPGGQGAHQGLATKANPAGSQAGDSLATPMSTLGKYLIFSP